MKCSGENGELGTIWSMPLHVATSHAVSHCHCQLMWSAALLSAVFDRYGIMCTALTSRGSVAAPADVEVRSGIIKVLA